MNPNTEQPGGSEGTGSVPGGRRISFLARRRSDVAGLWHEMTDFARGAVCEFRRIRAVTWLYMVAILTFCCALLWLAKVNSVTLPSQPNVDDPTQGRLLAAVEMSVSLSGQVVSASFMLLTMLAAFIGFFLTERVASELFRLCSVIAGLATVASIWVSGIAITKARNAVWLGTWDLGPAKEYFNMQAELALLGILFFSIVLVVFGGQPKSPNKDLARLERDLHVIASGASEISKLLRHSFSPGQKELGPHND